MLTSGFYNSDKGDRKYDATAISRIFDGIILDGVYAAFGDSFALTPGEGLSINIGSGRAWLEHTWSYNDSLYNIVPDTPSPLYDRYDAIVLNVNTTKQVRQNSFQKRTGTPAIAPEYPELVNEEGNKDYVIGYVKIRVNASEITAEDIELRIGTSDFPFVLAALQTIDIDLLKSQVEAEYRAAMASLILEGEATIEEISGMMGTLIEDKTAEFYAWYTPFKNNAELDMSTFQNNYKTSANAWIKNEEDTFAAWVANRKSIVDADVAEYIAWQEEFIASGNAWKTQEEADWTAWSTAFENDMNDWRTAEKNDFDVWFASIQAQLSGDVAANLQNQITEVRALANTAQSTANQAKALSETASSDATTAKSAAEAAGAAASTAQATANAANASATTALNNSSEAKTLATQAKAKAELVETNLAMNYYMKNEIYTKTEINTIITDYDTSTEVDVKINTAIDNAITVALNANYTSEVI